LDGPNVNAGPPMVVIISNHSKTGLRQFVETETAK
jgi:hypothetical protein